MKLTKEQKEKVHITIDEEPNTHEDVIKELKFILNTGQFAQVEHITDNILGDLSCIIISTNKAVNIKIVLAEYPTIILLNKVSFFGQDYFPLRKEAIYPDGKVAENAVEKWYLNNRLKILVDGNTDARVEFVIRYT